mmetsp:Transcript_3181/g.9209  ORF Transcript_3181/g.9209 Transcript_3181/m.9209 type:complete len:1144 (+) Transcript_3181:125-3556(+)
MAGGETHDDGFEPRSVIDGCDDEHGVAHVVIIACAAVFFGTVLRFAETQLLPLVKAKASWLALPPYTLSVFLVGVITSAIHDLLNAARSSEEVESLHASRLGVYDTAVTSAQLVDPHVILLVLLPPLIYESASAMSWHVFRRVAGQAFLLAFPGVVVQAFAVGAMFRYFSGYGADGGLWGWNISLVLGSIVCATDPVAVVATLHSLGAPEKISDVIDGESLLNDGSAMVLFLIFMENVKAEANGEAPITVAGGVAFFLRLALGGAVLGGVAFQVVVTWLNFVENDWRVELGILLVGVYACFGLAELGLEVSGVLAVVTFGLLMARRGKYAFSPEAAEMVESVMPAIAHVAESAIFYVAGIAAWQAIYSHVELVGWWHPIILYLVLAGVRAASVALLYPALNRMGYSLSPRESVLVVYAGLRGAVGLALGLIVVNDRDVAEVDAARIHFHVAATAALTMLVNGTTTPWLYDKLRLYPANKYRNVIVRRVVNDLEHGVMREIEERLVGSSNDFVCCKADWDVVRALTPCFTGLRVLENNRLQIPPRARPEPVFGDFVFSRISASAPRPELLRADSLADRAPTDADGALAVFPMPAGTIVRARAGSAAGNDISELARRTRSRSVDNAPAALQPSEVGHTSVDPARLDPAHGTRVRVEITTDPRKRWRSELFADDSAAAAAAAGRAGEAGQGAPAGVRLFRSRFASSGDAASRQPVQVAPNRSADEGAPAPPLEAHGMQGDAAMAARLTSLAHRERQAPRHQRARTFDASNAAPDLKRSSGTWRASLFAPLQPHPVFTSEEKRDGIVETLFAVLHKLYAEQYEHKQVGGAALGVLYEALSSGEEYLAEHPAAEAMAAFDLELDVLLYELPPEPAWRTRLPRMMPLVGEAVASHLYFYRAFERTEALAGFIRAHTEVKEVVRADATRLRVVKEAVDPVLRRAQKELEAHQAAHWSLVTLHINLLTARAAVEMKRDAVSKVAAQGTLSAADIVQIIPYFDSALYALDTVRHSLTAPISFRRALQRAQSAPQPATGAEGAPGGAAAEGEDDMSASNHSEATSTAPSLPDPSACVDLHGPLPPLVLQQPNDAPNLDASEREGSAPGANGGSGGEISCPRQHCEPTSDHDQPVSQPQMRAPAGANRNTQSLV